MKKIFTTTILSLTVLLFVGFVLPTAVFASSCGVSNTSITSTGYNATVTFQTNSPFPSQHFPIGLEIFLTGSGTIIHQTGINESECTKQLSTTSTVTYTCAVSAPNAFANTAPQPGATYVLQGVIGQANNDQGTSCQGYATAPATIAKTCGHAYNTATETCDCQSNAEYNPPIAGRRCCGWAVNTTSGCSATQPTIPPISNAPINPTEGATPLLFSKLNAAIFGAAGPDVQLTTPRGIISKLLPYLFSFAGLILFIMILWGGFEMLTGAADPKSQQAGKERITAAIIGFLLLFSSFWLAQIVQKVFGISIL
ncbi:MAG: pilin [Candidatus Woesebacteria bacterium]